LFIFILRESLTYADLRSDYKKLIDLIKRGKVKEFDINKRTVFDKLLLSVQLSLLIYISAFLIESSWSGIKIFIIIFVFISIIIFISQRLKY
jgi:glucan phosphoethanolaminetransferase (alkaline phosphatase superfamily)